MKHGWGGPGICFLLGAVLLVVNIYGLFVPLRAPGIYEAQSYFEDDITLTEEEVWQRIHTEYRSKEEAILAINAAVNQGMAHYDGDEVEQYNFRIPMYENYWLFLATHAYAFLTEYLSPFRDFFQRYRTSSDLLRKYEFSNYQKAIERGIGICSQHAIIMAQVLRKKGIKSKIWYLNGHVVTLAQVDSIHDRWWVVDADFGVVIPESADAVEDDPTVVASAYAAQGYSRQEIDYLVNIYGEGGNKIYATVADYHGKERFYKYYIEYLLYVLKWMLPIGLMLPYCWSSIQHIKEGF